MASDNSVGGVESHDSPSTFTFTASTIGFCLYITAPMFEALSCSWICSSCQSPQSRQTGMLKAHCQMSPSPGWQATPTRANCFGLRNTPLTRFTPDLSSLACTKSVFFSPARMARRSTHAATTVGGVLSERDDVTCSCADCSTGACAYESVALLLAMSETLRKLMCHIPSSASRGMFTRPM